MFCANCGLRGEYPAQFCSRCGNPIQHPLRTQHPTSTPRKDDAHKTAVILVVGSCFILACISISALNGFAEAVALICIAIFCFGWSKKGIGAGSKILFCAIATLLVVTLNGVQRRKEEQIRIEAIQAKNRQAIELQKSEEEAFSKLTPTQHLDRAKATLKVGADSVTLALANRDLDALKTTDLANQATQVRARYEASEASAKHAAAVAAEKSTREEKATEAAINRILRDQMAKTVENSMLDEGYNVDVTAEGPDHTTLRLRWIFVSKVFAHQLSQRTEVFENARKIGFKKIVATDGYDETWTWKL